MNEIEISDYFCNQFIMATIPEDGKFWCRFLTVMNTKLNSILISVCIKNKGIKIRRFSEVRIYYILVFDLKIVFVKIFPEKL